MRQIVICDLDGTLADCSHRQHHVQGEGKKNWKAFFSEMDKDVVNRKLNDILGALSTRYDIYFVSARPDNYRDKTTTWLREQAEWLDGEYFLYMRKAGDFRADTVVKQEILDQIKAEGVEILVAFDDRSSVVQMWRDNGIFCCQVAQHDF